MHSTARQTGRRPNRPAFTLIELLVVMGVLALMSSMVLVGLASAAEQARVTRTRGQIQKIHELLMTRWDEYRYRRVEAAKTGNVRARQGARLDKIRELMRMEMPDRISDVTDPAVSLNGSPSLQARYQRAVTRRTGAANYTAALSTWTLDNESSECLYMILESIQDGETNGLDYFKPSEIGDTDGDGLPEILDAWGKPILFVRWPYGFPVIATTGATRNALSNLNDVSSPDPFDPLSVRGGKVEISATPLVFDHFLIYPLVFSAGPNEIYNIVTDIGVNYSSTMPPNNPYVDVSGSRVGQIFDASGNELDNISNHALVISGNAN